MNLSGRAQKPDARLPAGAAANSSSGNPQRQSQLMEVIPLTSNGEWAKGWTTEDKSGATNPQIRDRIYASKLDQTFEDFLKWCCQRLKEKSPVPGSTWVMEAPLFCTLTSSMNYSESGDALTSLGSMRMCEFKRHHFGKKYRAVHTSAGDPSFVHPAWITNIDELETRVVHYSGQDGHLRKQKMLRVAFSIEKGKDKSKIQVRHVPAPTRQQASCLIL